MSLERIEYHPATEIPTQTQRVVSFLASGGFSLLERLPQPLSNNDRDAIEMHGYDPERVQPIVDWIGAQGIEGDKAAAVLRGAFNDLVQQINAQEASTQDS